MIESIKAFLLQFIMAVQARKIYSSKHPQFLDSSAKAYDLLSGLLEDRHEIIIGIVDGMLAWEDEVFFDLSERIESLIHYLQDRTIERLVFKKGISEDEFTLFISLLINLQKDESYEITSVLNRENIRNIDAGRIMAPVEKAPADRLPAVEAPDHFMKGTGNPLEIVAHFAETILHEEALDYLELKGSIQLLMDSFSGNRYEFLDLAAMKEKDIITFVHLMNVAILSMYFSSKLGHPMSDVIDIGIAALFHDIGKLLVSDSILSKDSKLEEEEFFKIQHHTIHGANILLKYTDTIGIMPFVVAYEHHIRYDLQGYPRLSFPMRPHNASAIVAICDVYDALAQRRSYKKDFSPLDIYETMIKERGIHFDPHLLDRYFQIMGVWPQGTLVSLSDGSIAVVRETNEKAIFSPKVERISPPDKGGLIDLSDESLGMRVEFSLNPFAEGKKYLSHI